MGAYVPPHLRRSRAAPAPPPPPEVPEDWFLTWWLVVMQLITPGYKYTRQTRASAVALLLKRLDTMELPACLQALAPLLRLHRRLGRLSPATPYIATARVLAHCLLRLACLIAGAADRIMAAGRLAAWARVAAFEVGVVLLSALGEVKVEAKGVIKIPKLSAAHKRSTSHTALSGAYPLYPIQEEQAYLRTSEGRPRRRPTARSLSRKHGAKLETLVARIVSLARSYGSRSLKGFNLGKMPAGVQSIAPAITCWLIAPRACLAAAISTIATARACAATLQSCAAALLCLPGTLAALLCKKAGRIFGQL